MTRMKISVTLDGPEWPMGWQSGEVAATAERLGAQDDLPRVLAALGDSNE